MVHLPSVQNGAQKPEAVRGSPKFRGREVHWSRTRSPFARNYILGIVGFAIAIAVFCLAGIGLTFTVGWSQIIARSTLQKCPHVVNASFDIAFVGNSLTYYNDLVHLVQLIIANSLPASDNITVVRVGACLRGGSSFAGTWEKGCNMANEIQIGRHDMFRSVASLLSCRWDVVVLQDFSMAPVVLGMREESLVALKTHYQPLLLRNGWQSPSPLALLYATWAYREPNALSSTVGDFDTVSDRLEEGYRLYAHQLRSAGLEVAVARAGRAFQSIHHTNRSLWLELYHGDILHPSAKATFLNAAHLVAAMVAHPRFRHIFPEGLNLTSSWPLRIQPLGGAPPPSVTALSTVIGLAGPVVLSARLPPLEI